MEGKDFLIAAILLIGVFLAGYLISPEYISLEQGERDNYEGQINYLEAFHAEELGRWHEYKELREGQEASIREEEEAECVIEKAETADRMSERNQELITINDDWQDLFEDMNESVHDLNNTIADLNCWR